MTVVIADTSPINYLILIDYIQLLPKLYRRVVIPVEVFHELSAQGAPPQVSAWISNLPQWIEVRAAIPDVKFALTLSYDELDAGELAALRLASSESGSFLLIDDAAGRAAAAELGIANTGTLGVLIAASHRQLLDLDEAVARLRATSFRISRALIDRALVENRKGFQIT